MSKKLAVGAVAAPALLAAGIWGYASSLPAAQRSVTTVALADPPEVVWAAITDYEALPEWRASVDGVTSEAFGWIEHTSVGDLPIKVTAMDPPNQMILRIDPDADLGVALAWRYELRPSPTGTELTLEEELAIEPPLLRLSMHINGPDLTAEAYLAELEARLEETR